MFHYSAAIKVVPVVISINARFNVALVAALMDLQESKTKTDFG